MVISSRASPRRQKGWGGGVHTECRGVGGLGRVGCDVDEGEKGAYGRNGVHRLCVCRCEGVAWGPMRGAMCLVCSHP